MYKGSFDFATDLIHVGWWYLKEKREPLNLRVWGFECIGMVRVHFSLEGNVSANHYKVVHIYSVQGYFYYDEVGPFYNGNLPIHMGQRVTEQFDEYENDASQIRLLSQTLSQPNSSCTRAYENGLESALYRKHQNTT